MAKTSISPIARMIERLAEDHRLKTLSDEELLRRFSSGQDEAAYAGLLRRHGPMVLDVCRNVAGNEADAEDVFQATFLILARKAKSIRKTTSIGSWLHGVAYRTALNGRKELARRRKHEGHAPRATGQDSTDDLSWHEVQELIHAELAALSERYRAPLVLCFLEGRTQDEAARQLGIAKATLKNHLERGRALLRTRLVRHGLGPTALVAASAWPAASASACVAPKLTAATLKAAMALAGGQATAGLVSVKVGYLVANALKVTLATKVQIGMVVVLALALAPTFGERAFQTHSTGRAISTRAVAQAPLPAATPKGEPGTPKPSGPQKKQTFIGRVLDPMGKPAAGAKLFLLGADERPVDLGRSAADGRFAVPVMLPNAKQWHYLVARTEGAGIDFIRVPESVPTEPIELRLLRDRAIRGRIVNTEGKPVAGAKVSVAKIDAYADDALDSFLSEWKKLHSMRTYVSHLPFGVKHVIDESGLFLYASTDADGRFTLAGTGAERFVQLRVRGNGIAEAKVLVVNREGFDPKPYNQASDDNVAAVQGYTTKWLLNGPDFTFVAETERLIRGSVTDRNTGAARPGVKVRLARSPAEQMWPLLSATTDLKGHYEIRGARKAKLYELEVASDSATGHLASRVQAKDTPGYEPISADIGVNKGVILTGRLIDASTKKPLSGNAWVGVLADNPFAKKYPQYDSIADRGMVSIGTDGKFRLVTIPGPVVLMGGPEPDADNVWGAKYKPVVSDPRYPKYFGKVQDFSWYNGPGASQFPLQGNFCKVIEIEPGAEIVTHDIAVERATALIVKINDSDGNPVAGTWVTGIGPSWSYPIQIKLDSCSAYHLEPGKSRLMVFYEPTKKLVGTLALKGDEKGPIVATLSRPGSVKGRLIAEDGTPLVGLVINLHFPERTAAEIHDHIHRANLIETDSDGKFQMDIIVPGQNFSLSFSRGTQTFEPLTKLEHRSVLSGAMLDVGETKLKRKTQQDN